MKRSSLILFICLALTVIGCGGGSGGGSGGGGGNASQGFRTLYASLDAPLIQAASADGEVLYQEVGFGDTPGYARLSEGEHAIRLSALSGASITSSVIDVANRGRYSLLFYGSFQTGGQRLSVFTDGAPDLQGGMGAVRALHGMLFALELRLEIGGMQRVASFGGATDYISLEPGIYDFVLRRTADGGIGARGSIAVEAGRSYSILGLGEMGVFSAARVLED